MKRDARRFGNRAQVTFRGSKRRLRSIRLRDHIGCGFVWLVLWVLFILIVLVPWIASRLDLH